MGLIRGLLKGAVASAVINAARKPENQAKVKAMIAEARAKRGRRS